MNTLNMIRKKVLDTAVKVCVTSSSFIHKNANHIMLFVGVVLLVGGLLNFSYAVDGEGGSSFSEASYNDTLVRNAVGNIFSLIEGAFGALIMVVAGVGAIVSAAMGAYRLAMASLVIAIGAFILRAMVSLFFGENFTNKAGESDT